MNASSLMHLPGDETNTAFYWGKEQSRSPYHTRSWAVVKKTYIHVTLSIFNRPRPCCIFQQWEALDGNFHSTAVKAFQQCITQHVIKSWSWIFTHLLLPYDGGIIRAASWTLKTQWNRERRREISIIHGICGENRPQQPGHILCQRQSVSEGSQLLHFLAKIISIPLSSPEHEQGAVRKMSSL